MLKEPNHRQPKYAVGDKIKTAFLKGEVREVIDGNERGWASDSWYYLVAPIKPNRDFPRPHHVRDDEVLVSRY